MGGPTIRIPARFNGPPDSANGGYSCGLVATAIGARAAEVTLRSPPPLDTELGVERFGSRICVRHRERVVAEGRPAAVALELPEPVHPARAAEAARDGFEKWAAEHPFPSCFVCGPARDPGDGLRIFPGPLDGEGVFACSWTPDASFAGPGGAVQPEWIWAALDCPTSAPIAKDGGGGPMVLGRLAVSLDAEVPACTPHAIVSWELGGEGRKRIAGAALFDAGGRPLARSRALWIELREG